MITDSASPASSASAWLPHHTNPCSAPRRSTMQSPWASPTPSRSSTFNPHPADQPERHRLEKRPPGGPNHVRPGQNQNPTLQATELRRTRAWAVGLAARQCPMTPPSSAFAGFRLPSEVIVIVVAVRWYLRYGLSSAASTAATKGLSSDTPTLRSARVIANMDFLYPPCSDHASNAPRRESDRHQPRRWYETFSVPSAGNRPGSRAMMRHSRRVQGAQP